MSDLRLRMKFPKGLDGTYSDLAKLFEQSIKQDNGLVIVPGITYQKTIDAVLQSSAYLISVLLENSIHVYNDLTVHAGGLPKDDAQTKAMLESICDIAIEAIFKKEQSSSQPQEIQ